MELYPNSNIFVINKIFRFKEISEPSHESFFYFLSIHNIKNSVINNFKVDFGYHSELMQNL